MNVLAKRSLASLGEQTVRMLLRVGSTLIEATERVLLFLGSAALHKGVDFGMLHTAPKIPHGDEVQEYLDTVVYIAFLVIYAALLYEFVAVFIPFLKPFKRRAEKEVIDESINIQESEQQRPQPS